METVGLPVASVHSQDPVPQRQAQNFERHLKVGYVHEILLPQGPKEIPTPSSG